MAPIIVMAASLANSTHRQQLTTHATDRFRRRAGLPGADAKCRVLGNVAYPRFQWTDSTTGIRNEGVYNSKTGQYDHHRPRAFFTASWHDESSRYSIGGSQQNDVSRQVQGIFEKRIPLDDGYALKGELLGFYARLEGLSRSSTQPNETGLVSAQFTWSAPGAACLPAAAICNTP